MQGASEVQWGLATELDDHSVRVDAVADVEHVFDGERLKEEQIAGVVVGADGFRVGVDHDRFDTHFAECEAGVAAAVVEFNPLADPVWSATEDDYPFRAGRFRRRFAFGFVSAVVIRRVSFELGSAGVD